MELDSGDVKQLLAILQHLVEKVTVAKVDTDTVEEKKTKKSTKKQKAVVETYDEEKEDENEIEFSSKIKSKKLSVKQRSKNKFDAMPESKMHKDDTAIDKKLIVSPPTQRNRSYQAVSARCRVCGKVESVSPSLVESPDRYKCNRCSASAG